MRFKNGECFILNELQKIVDLLKEHPYSLRELAVAANIDKKRCSEYVATLKELGVIYETKIRKKKEIHLRQLPVGPKIGVMSLFKSVDDIEILDEDPPKPDEIIDLIQ